MRLNATVLVTDGEQRSALATVRSLGRAGCRVFVAAEASRSLAGASRYARGSVFAPDPLSASERYVEAIAAACGERRVDVLLPMTEASLLALLPVRERLGEAVLPFPSADTFRAVSDKEEVLRRARTLGLCVPRQVVAETPDEAEAALDSTLPFPVVLKPGRSVAEGSAGRVRLGVRHAEDADALRRHLREMPDAAFPILLQQRIVGPGVGIFLLLWKGRQLGTFAHRRIREKPPSGGVSVYRESVPPDPELLDASERLLKAFDWQGVAMVEYKVDQRTGEAYVMEVNGRFWGSLQLAIDAGVDFPALLVAAALGRAPAPVHEYRTGIRCRWWWGDLDHLLLRLRRSEDELSLPPGTPGRWRALGEFLVPWRPGDRNEVLRLSDPRPFVRESVDWLRSATRSRRGSVGEVERT